MSWEVTFFASAGKKLLIIMVRSWYVQQDQEILLGLVTLENLELPEVLTVLVNQEVLVVLCPLFHQEYLYSPAALLVPQIPEKQFVCYMWQWSVWCTIICCVPMYNIVRDCCCLLSPIFCHFICLYLKRKNLFFYYQSVLRLIIKGEHHGKSAPLNVGFYINLLYLFIFTPLIFNFRLILKSCFD